MPSSVSFCTTHSGRSAFGIAKATVRGSGRQTPATSPVTSSSPLRAVHARQRPGSHVIVRTAGQRLPNRVLQRAAELAAFYSQGRTDSRVAVDWTPRKFVRRIRGGPPGLVSYINEQTVDVPPRGPH